MKICNQCGGFVGTHSGEMIAGKTCQCAVPQPPPAPHGPGEVPKTVMGILKSHSAHTNDLERELLLYLETIMVDRNTALANHASAVAELEKAAAYSDRLYAEGREATRNLIVALRERDEAQNRLKLAKYEADAWKEYAYGGTTPQGAEDFMRELTATKAALAAARVDNEAMVKLAGKQNGERIDLERALAAKQQECDQLNAHLDDCLKAVTILRTQLTAEQLAHEKTKTEKNELAHEAAKCMRDFNRDLIAATQRAEAAEKIADRLAAVMLRAIPTVQSRLTDYEEEYTAALQAHRQSVILAHLQGK